MNDDAKRFFPPPLKFTGDPAQLEAFQNAINSRWGPNLIDAAEAKAKGVLTAVGMSIEKPWLLEAEAVKDGYPVGSKVWCCAKILEDIRRVRQAYDSGSRDDLMHEALHLGSTLAKINVLMGKD